MTNTTTADSSGELDNNNPNYKGSFDVLQRKDWILDWDCVKFRNGYIIVFPPMKGSVKFKPKAVSVTGAIEVYNYLIGYLKERLEPVHCYVEGMDLVVYDTIRLNEAIVRFSSAARQHGITISGHRNKKFRPKIIPYNKALSKARQLTAEDFKKYKSAFIDFLAQQQSKNYKVIPCVENLSYIDTNTTEYAFMFSLECKNGSILIVHENVNPDRSTILFVIEKDTYDKSIRYIYDFMQSAIINKRSSIREGGIMCNDKIINYKSINHDDISSWQNIISVFTDTLIPIPHKENNLLKKNFSSLSRLLHELQTKQNFPKVKSVFQEHNLPLSRKLRPKQIINMIPDSACRIDKDGNKVLPISNGLWSLEKLIKLLDGKKLTHQQLLQN